jgi:uncharacterized protein YbjT (DUF2867 family)
MKHRILVAGATGYLGRHLVMALQNQGADFCALARNSEKLEAMGLKAIQIRQAQVTKADTLEGCCEGIDVVISCVGITRQKDGLGYMNVDYQANINLLEQAEKSGVKKFIYISAFNAPKFQSVRLLQAKEQFAQRLLASHLLKPCVIRPNGFYSDIDTVYAMAKAGRAYVFGEGDTLFNPIHGEDLARFCLESITLNERELDVGGQEALSLSQIVSLAFQALDKPEKTTRLPDFIRKAVLALVRRLPESLGGTLEFFLTVSGQDMLAPMYGQHQVLTHFKSLS